MDIEKREQVEGGREKGRERVEGQRVRKKGEGESGGGRERE